MVITVSFHGVPVHAERNDICSRAECPIAPGGFTLENTQPLPRITPPVSSGQHPEFLYQVAWKNIFCFVMVGCFLLLAWSYNSRQLRCQCIFLILVQGDYKIKLQFLGEDDDVLACADITFTIVWGKFQETSLDFFNPLQLHSKPGLRQAHLAHF